MMQRAVLLLSEHACLLLHFGDLEAVAGNEDRILAAAQNMGRFEDAEIYTS